MHRDPPDRTVHPPRMLPQPRLRSAVRRGREKGLDALGGDLGNAVEITERKRAEEALREREFDYRSLFESAGVGNAETALESGRFTRVNQHFCDLVGYTEGELTGGMTFAEITHPDD